MGWAERLNRTRRLTMPDTLNAPLTLAISEQTMQLLTAADRAVQDATDRRNLVLSATFAAAKIPGATVVGLDRNGDGYVLTYTLPNGKGG